MIPLRLGKTDTPYLSRERLAFSLTELLVVVAIMAVLSVLLLTGLRTVQIQAKKAQSLANLRAIGSALAMYTTENGGCFPASCSSAYGYPFWTDSLGSYVPPPVTMFKPDTGAKYTISPVFVDPLLLSNRHHALGDYGANSDLFYGPTGWPITTSPVRMQNLSAQLSGVIAVMTAEDAGMTPPCGSWFLNRKDIVNSPESGWGNSRPGARNLDSYLCLFADFHTETIKKNDFLQRRKELMSLNP